MFCERILSRIWVAGQVVPMPTRTLQTRTQVIERFKKATPAYRLVRTGEVNCTRHSNLCYYEITPPKSLIR